MNFEMKGTYNEKIRRTEMTTSLEKAPPSSVVGPQAASFMKRMNTNRMPINVKTRVQEMIIGKSIQSPIAIRRLPSGAPDESIRISPPQFKVWN
jgi:hypothetical protein